MKPGDIKWLAAMTEVGPLAVEVLEVRGGSDEVVRWAEELPDGYWHFVSYHRELADAEDARKSFDALGVPVVLSGRVGGTKFFMFDTRRAVRTDVRDRRRRSERCGLAEPYALTLQTRSRLDAERRTNHNFSRTAVFQLLAQFERVCSYRRRIRGSNMTPRRMTEHTPETLPGSVERESPVPYYFQLATLFEHEILSGRWSPNSRLPSESELCSYYEVSRTTVRQALARLEQQGSIRRVRGQGTYVAQARPRSWMLHSPLGLFEGEMYRLGQVTSKVLRSAVSVLPNWATDALELPPGSQGVTLERLRSVDGLVVLYVVNHLPAAFAKAALSYQSPDESLYERLRERLGIEVVSGIRNIEAVIAEEKMAELLDVPPNTPLCFIESVSWDQNQRPFDCYRAWVRTDRIKIEIQISSSSGHSSGTQPGLGRTPPIDLGITR